jgi:pyruvate/2-oxoglutarate dehydrogenase complex dihydrolipoamide dehydrogenase (E3) component
MTVAVGLAGLGRKVPLIEGHHVGGDCTNVGCMPSKTLIHLAKNFKPGMNPDDALREVTRKRDALRDKETEEVQHMQNLTFIQGMAKFTAPKTLRVTLDGATRELTAFTLAMSQKISLYKIYRLVYPHPTYSSGILKVADFFMRETLPNLGKEIAAYLKYRFAKPSRG